MVKSILYEGTIELGTGTGVDFVCMYVCMYDNLCSRSSLQPKLSPCHVGAMVSPLQNISVFSRAQNCIRDINGSRSVSSNGKGLGRSEP